MEYIYVTARFVPGEEDEGGYVVQSEELGIATQGESIEEARENFEDAVKEFIAGLYESGDLYSFLQERNIPIYHDVPPEDTTVRLSRGEVVSAMVATLGKSVAFI